MQSTITFIDKTKGYTYTHLYNHPHEGQESTYKTETRDIGLGGDKTASFYSLCFWISFIFYNKNV